AGESSETTVRFEKYCRISFIKPLALGQRNRDSQRERNCRCFNYPSVWLKGTRFAHTSSSIALISLHRRTLLASPLNALNRHCRSSSETTITESTSSTPNDRNESFVLSLNLANSPIVFRS